MERRWPRIALLAAVVFLASHPVALARCDSICAIVGDPNNPSEFSCTFFGPCPDNQSCVPTDADGNGTPDCCRCPRVLRRSYIIDSDGKRVYQEDLMKLLREKLGADAQDVQIVISACFSGGFADEAQGGSFALQGNSWSLMTLADDRHSNLWSTSKSKDPNGIEFLNGVRGLQVTEDGNDPNVSPAKVRWTHGPSPYYTKALLADPNGLAINLYNSSRADGEGSWLALLHLFDPNLTETFQNPRFVSGGTGSTARVHDGIDSNHAIIWSPITADPNLELRAASLDTRTHAALEKAGYPMVGDPNDDNNSIDYASGVKLSGATLLHRKITRNRATKTSLEDMLRDLGGRLRQHPGREKAFIYLHAHGNLELRKDVKKVGAIYRRVLQGKEFNDGDEVKIDALDASFRASLLEKVITNNPSIIRAGPPAVVATTSEENYAGTVNVALDGITVGSFQMAGSATGGEYEVSINDGSLQQIATAGILDDESVNISFAFGPGSFRTATDWDFDAGISQSYGVGIAGPPVATMVIGTCAPAPELCDGEDNDCDGLVDEDLGNTTCGAGLCQRTVPNCYGGVPQTCTPGSPTEPEVCDGTDNNCNGQIDEGITCAPPGASIPALSGAGYAALVALILAVGAASILARRL